MGLFSSLFGAKKKSSPEVRGARLAVQPEDEEIVQGQQAKLCLKITAPGKPLCLDFLQFDLVNRREERKAFLDKMITSSRFVFRININRELTAGEEAELEIEFLPPICREGTRKTKFVTILWEIQPTLYFSDCGDGNGHGSYRFIGEHQELVIKGRR